MREILFRGKRIDTEEWVEGNLLHLKGFNGYMNYIIPEVTNGSWDKKDYMLKFISPCFEVDIKSICQYTGLTDKNDRRIFEGDIVNCNERGTAFWNCKVVWNEENARFDVENKDCRFPMCLDGYGSDNFIRGLNYEVIGNIFDNPELLKGCD